MVLIVSDDNTDEWAAVWDGSNWGHTVVLDTVTTGNRTEIAVAFESQSGHAMVIYDGINNYNDLNYQTWNGTVWSGPQVLTLPYNGLAETDARFTTIAADPTSDRIAIGVVTTGTENQVVFAIWDGAAWGNKLMATNSLYTGTSPVAAVGFESQSGELLVTYGELATTPRYQTWSSGSGWSGELNMPDIGAYATVMMLASDPLTDAQMLAVQDTDSDLHYILWDGDVWGADNELSTNTGETNLLRPFTFVFDAAPPPANQAPILDNSPILNLDPVSEDPGAPVGAVGTLVSSLVDLAGGGGLDNVTDADPGALTGIAVTQAATGLGTWYYSIDDGNNWYLLTGASNSNALLLTPASRLYFEPNPDFNGLAINALQFRAWDQTSGTNGSFADTTVHGGSSAYSSVVEFVSAPVTAANDAPVLDNSGTMTLTTINEDQTSNGGNTVASIIASAGGNRITDVDSGAVEGIAITSLVSGNGTWEYSTNGGGSWTAIGAVSDLSALLLRDTDLVRFVPDANNGTTASFDFRAWDQTSGAVGTKVDVSTSGGITAFSSVTETAGITVTSVNDAPVLDPNGTTSLTTITEDETNNGGDTIAAIIASAGGDRITDVDSGALEGIAIYNLVSSNGTWQYNTGSGWTDVGAVSVSSSLLLRATDSLRFVPDGQNSDTAFVTYAAWDQTTGTAGTKVDTSVYGGTTAFSDQVETSAISVTAVNDAPVLADTALGLTIAENSGAPSGAVGALISAFTGGITDVDNGAVKGIAIVASDETNGTWYYSTNSGTNWTAVGVVNTGSSLLLGDNGNTRLYFAPNTSYNGTSASALTIRAWDQTGGGTAGTRVSTASTGGTTPFSSATDVVDVTVTPVNDAPTLDNSGTMTLTTITEDQTTSSGNTVASIIASAGGDRITDVDSGAVEGIAITTLVSGTGTWQYSTNGGGSWTAIGVVSNSSALLLRDTDLVRFVPNGQNGTTASFDFRAWDQTSGTFGTKVDVSTNGGTTAFSTATETASITVTDVNDEQVLSTNTGMTVLEGSVGNVITTAMLETTDVDNTAAQLVYTVNSVPTNGVLRRNGINLSVSSTFTQADIDAGIITYSHNDTETTSDSFSFTVDDGAGTNSSGTFNITITLVNDNSITAISDNDAAADFVLENVTAGTTVGVTAFASDADTTDTVSYTLDDDAGGLFAIDGVTGVVTVAGTIDREAAASYNITVRATSTDTTTSTRVFAIAIGDVDEFDVGPVTDSDGTANAVDENAANGTTVGVTALASDADATNNTITYTLDDNAGGRFAIDGSTGVVTVADGTLLNRELAASHNITVRATSVATAVSIRPS